MRKRKRKKKRFNAVPGGFTLVGNYFKRKEKEILSEKGKSV